MALCGAWRGVVWCVVAWRGVAWCGVVWCGVGIGWSWVRVETGECVLAWGGEGQ